MFFLISKIIGILVQPLNALLLVVALCIILLGTTWRKFAKRLLVLAALTYTLCAHTQLADVLLATIEPPRGEQIIEANREQISGIIILGGAINTNKQNRRDDYHTNDGAERLIEGLALARQLPTAKLVYSGGDGSLLGKGGVDGTGFERIVAKLGGVANPLLVEKKSKNTFQNAQFTREILGGNISGKWVLVTSAFHMGRSRAIFEKAGFDVLAWPTDYRADVIGFPYLTAASARQFWKLETFIHEILGHLVYRITGRL